MADTVITGTDTGSNSSGIIFGIIIAILLLVGVFLFGTANLGNNTSSNPNPIPQSNPVQDTIDNTAPPANDTSNTQGGEGGSVNLDIPEQVDVNLNNGQGQSPQPTQ